MSLLDYDVDSVPELTTMAAGAHQVKIVSAEIRQQKPEKGTSSFLYLRLVPTEDPNAKDIGHVIMLPDDNKDERENNSRLRRLKEFVMAFGLQIPLDTDTMTDTVGVGVLSQEDDEEYGEQNRIRRFLVN